MPGIPSQRVSSGQVAATSNPATPTAKVTVQAAPPEFNDTGTNAPVVTLKQSQATAPLSYDAAVKKANSAKQATPGEAPTAPKSPAVAKAPPADAGPAVQPATPAQPGRNKYFNNDYYIDDLEIVGAFTGSRGPSSFQELSFKVTEPNGISLAYNLTKAVQDLYKSKDVFPVNAVFVMVIRFYGWDEKGNLVTKVSPVEGTPGAVPNNSNAVVVKYLPFNITNLDFKMNGKVVEYHIKAAGLTHYKYAQSTALGTVPHNWQLVGETVEQVLNGTATAATGGGDDSKRTTTAAPAQAKSPVTRTQETLTTVSDLKNSILNPFGGSKSAKNDGWGEG